MDQYITVIDMIMRWLAIWICFKRMGVNNNITVRNMSMIKEQGTPHKQEENHQHGEPVYFIKALIQHCYYLRS